MILLNVVRSIRLILEAVADVHALQNPSTPSPISSSLPGSRPGSGPSTPPEVPENVPRLTSEHLKLRMRLLPLLQVEEVLIRKLTSAGSGEHEATRLANLASAGVGMGEGAMKEREVAVNTQFAWKNMFARLVGGRASYDSDSINFDDPNVSVRTSCLLCVFYGWVWVLILVDWMVVGPW